MEGNFNFTSGEAVDEHTTAGISQDETVLLFRSGAIYACATLSQITELIRLPSFTRVPLSAPWIVGLFNHRSDPVIAVSMSRCLGLAEKDSPDGFLILTGERGHQISFWVDEVTDIITPDPRDWQAVPDHLTLPYCYGILARRDRLYVGLRFDELLKSLEGNQNGHGSKDAKLKLRSMVDAKAALQYYEATTVVPGEATSDSADEPNGVEPAATTTVKEQPAQSAGEQSQTPTPPPPPSKEKARSFVESVMKFQDEVPTTPSEPETAVEVTPTPEDATPLVDALPAPNEPAAEEGEEAAAEPEPEAEPEPKEEEEADPSFVVSTNLPSSAGDAIADDGKPETSDNPEIPAPKKKPVKFFVAGMDIPDAIKNISSSHAAPEPTPPPVGSKESSSLDKPMALGGMDFPMEHYSDLLRGTSNPAPSGQHQPSWPEQTPSPEKDEPAATDNAPTTENSVSAETEMAGGETAGSDSIDSQSGVQSPPTENWIVDAEERVPAAAGIETPNSAADTASSAIAPESAAPQPDEGPTKPSIQPKAAPEGFSAAKPATVPASRLPTETTRPKEQIEQEEQSDARDSDDDRRLTPAAIAAGVIMVLLLAIVLWLTSGRGATRGKSATEPSASGSQQATVTIPAPPPTPVPEDAGQTEDDPLAATATIPVPPPAAPAPPPEAAGQAGDQAAASSAGDPAGSSDSSLAGSSDGASGGATPAPRPTSETTRTPNTITLPGGPPYVLHRVVRGDSLSKIARRYLYDMMRYPELVEENDIVNPDLIYPGDIIRVPVARKEEEE